MENGEKINIDILKHLEDLSNKINNVMASRTRAVFEKYPITFGLLILFGVTTLHEGIKGLMHKFGLLDLNPIYLLVTGLLILIITGTLYKKLDK